jgi:hypothetical protein
VAKPQAPDRWGGKNFSPIGRGRATWENENYPDVHPDDRGTWEWLQERQKALASLELDHGDDALFWDRVRDLEERQRTFASLEAADSSVCGQAGLRRLKLLIGEHAALMKVF